MSALFQPVLRQCPCCKQDHYGITQDAWDRKVDACRVESIGRVNHMAWRLSQPQDVATSVDPEADTVVKPIQVAS
jgi:hypothetical protein